MTVNKVMISIGSTDGIRCVDVFRHPDGSFGFQEFRRDVEDISGWFPVGARSSRKYPTKSLAMRAACKSVGWLERP